MSPRPNWSGNILAGLSTQRQDGVPCRVCDQPVASGSSVWGVSWRPGIAHEVCGYLRADEREVHEVNCELRTWWAWECPTCERDAASMYRPRDGDPMECRRCRKPMPVIGALVEATHVGQKAIVGKVGRSVHVERGARGMVVGTPREDVVCVEWGEGPKRPKLRTLARLTEVRAI